MSVKRRDNKGRILRNGESQRKDGRYAYKYVGLDGESRFIYSWKLESTDKMPKGKRMDISLREKERVIQRDLEDGINSNGGNMKFATLVEQFIEQRKSAAISTKAGYVYALNVARKHSFGTIKIKDINSSYAKKIANDLFEGGLAYGTVVSIIQTYRCAFEEAVDDDILRKNPFRFIMYNVLDLSERDIRKYNREALPNEVEESFLDFVKNEKRASKHYEPIFILFKTGLRISELAGLTFKDIDFKERKIYVTHQLRRTDKMKYYIAKPKSKKGVREIPMTDDVVECFRRIIDKRRVPKVEPIIDGYGGFLFLTRNDIPVVSRDWEKYFTKICNRYNKKYGYEEGEGIYVTPHICRHTYCTNLVNAGLPPQIVQYLMGHADISTTLNIYYHGKFTDVQVKLDDIMDAIG